MKAEISRGGQIDLFGPLTERQRTILITPPRLKIEVDIAQMERNDFVFDVKQAAYRALDEWLSAELRTLPETG